MGILGKLEKGRGGGVHKLARHPSPLPDCTNVLHLSFGLPSVQAGVECRVVCCTLKSYALNFRSK